MMISDDAVTIEGIVTKTHETVTPQKENVLYFEVSNFNDSSNAGAERVVYRIVFDSSSSSKGSQMNSQTKDSVLPIHFGDKVIYTGKIPFSKDDSAITPGKIIEWNSIHPKSKPFFVACSSIEYIKNHVKNVFKDSDDKMVDTIVDAFQKAAKAEGLKTISSFLTFCSCKYIFLRETEDVSPNLNSMISKERFTNTASVEKDKRRVSSSSSLIRRRKEAPHPPRYPIVKKTASVCSSVSKSLIFSGVLNPFDDLTEISKGGTSKKCHTPKTSKAAEFIISITESKPFKPSEKGPYVLTPRQLELVLVTWCRDNCLRPFHLLGLTKQEIKESAKTAFLRSTPTFSRNPCECFGKGFPWCGLCNEGGGGGGGGCDNKPILSSGTFDYDDLIILYELITKCPFAFKSIPMKKAIDIFHSHRPSSTSNVPKNHLFCGHLLRKLEEDKNSTCLEITGSSFEESFNENESLLKCVYGVFTYTRPSGRKFAYLFERFKIEKTISKLVSECIIHSSQMDAHRKQKSKELFSDDDDSEDAVDEDEYDKDDKIVLTEEQRSAVEAIVSSSGGLYPSIITVTGGPGVGKTTILKEVITKFRENNIRYRVSSFTGKAVSRIKEKTKCKARFASTLDRLIAKGDVFGFEHLIIDEASMVTSQLLFRFLMARKSAISKAASSIPSQPPLKITFIGDPDQLPPIEWGNLFSILLDFPNEWIPSFKLTSGFRLISSPTASSASVSPSIDIIQNAFESIRRSSPSDFKKVIEKASASASASGLVKSSGVASSPFVLIQNAKERGYEDVIDRVNQIKTLYSDADPSKFGIFSPYNQDVNIFNSLVRDVFSGSPLADDDISKSSSSLRQKFEIGDRVIMTKNVYFPGDDESDSEDDENLDGEKGGGFAYMNGDTGVVKEINETGIFVDFDTGPKCVFFQWETPSRKAINEAIESSPDLKMKAFEEDLKDILLKSNEGWWGDEEDADEANGGGGSGGAIPLNEKILYVDLLKLAFSLTIHKSQGSEYDHVIVHIPRRPLGMFKAPSSPSFVQGDRSFINRNLLYTALTRARKTVTIITPGTFENEITSAILSKPPLRYGNLGHRVVDCLFERDFHHLIVAKDDEVV